MAAGEPVTIEPRSMADGLLAPFTTQICIDLVNEYRIELVQVEEPEIGRAMRRLYSEAKLACEPAAAAGVAALSSGAVELEKGQNVVVIVSGGNVDPLVASDILTQE